MPTVYALCGDTRLTTPQATSARRFILHVNGSFGAIIPIARSSALGRLAPISAEPGALIE
jgi:hypothetical protein